MKVKTFPVLLISIGALLLLDSTNFLNLGWNVIIPILMIVVGGVKVFNSLT